MLDVRRILLLVEVADRGSISAAAETTMITSSAASQQMTRLETEAGQPLLHRHRRGVTLTDAGRALVDRGRAIRRELGGAEADLDSLARLDRGTLRLGSFPTVSASLLPLALTRFARKHPGTETTVRSALLNQLLDLLHGGEIELATLWDYDWNRIDDPAVHTEHLLDDPTVLVVPANSELLEQGTVGLTDLAAQQWIIRADNHPVAEVLRRSCHLAGFEPTISYESHDYQEAQAMVAAGLGIAVAPRLAMTNRRHDVRLLEFATDVPAPTRRILLAHPASRPPTPAAAAMAGILHAVAERFRATRLDTPNFGLIRRTESS
ncbi:DNA-binding transcriptional LysR family regulator [Saccharopolyspora lacisalsi]|uniref:DNA-binding transcriptional LysR family regulator n=1 Tax=Halosaccharopolyspora lacisalsi TaxID=1000566 RepID=A0A839DZ84_9PSEU|nr:LysR family transcriptional regulator [Halosaccharopolyspora lacisalsi]MBA8826814.1 DNA-binding transcriptional LysR family regulator [Halosaccharopolyspora lacisalsi]